MKSIKSSILVLVLLFNSHIMGLTVKDASIEELTFESRLIVHGKVESVKYVWEDQNLKKINTLVKIQVIDYLKGTGDSEIDVVQMGGKMDDIEDIIYGTPRLKENDEVLLFLVKENNHYVIHSIISAGRINKYHNRG